MGTYSDLCNKDYTLQFLPQSSATPSQNPQKIEITSTKNLEMNKETLVTLLTLIQNVCIYAGYSFVSGVSTIDYSSEKCLCESQFSLRKDDDGTCSGTFTHNQNGSTYNCSCKVKILDAGQIKVQGK